MSQQVALHELERVAVLGAGAFGQVVLVKRDGRYYALKILSKAHLVQAGLTVRCSACACRHLNIDSDALWACATMSLMKMNTSTKPNTILVVVTKPGVLALQPDCILK